MTASLSRRLFLHVGSVALIGATAGCNIRAGQHETFTFCHLEVFNEDQEAHRVHLHIEADGGTIHDESYELSGATEDGVSDKELDPQEWFDGTAQQLTLNGQVDDQPAVGPVELSASNLGEHAEIIYHIQDDGSLEIKYLVAGGDNC